MLPLDSLQVVDASSYVAGPFGGLMLADLGAHVVKVERRPKGDPLRTIGFRHAGRSVQYESLNRRKRVVLLDLKVAADQEEFLRLVSTADVLIQSSRIGADPDAQAWEQRISQANPQLIRVRVSGYGSDGPLSRRPTFDALIQAHSGLADRQGRGGRPQTVATYIADKVTSMVLVQSVLAAVIRRERTGEGDSIEVPMLDSIAYFNFPDCLEDRTYLADDAVASSRPVAAPLVLEASDGFIALAPASGRQLRAAFAAAGLPDDLERLRVVTDATALLNAVMVQLQAVAAARTVQEWVTQFSAFDVPVAPVLNFDQHLTDVQVVNNRIYGVEPGNDGTPKRFVRYPARFQRSPEMRADTDRV